MPRSRLQRTLYALRVPLAALTVLVLAIIALDVLIDGPLRRRIEGEMNERLEGYTVALGEVDFRPWNLSLELLELSVVQDAHPEPPVALLPRVAFSVHWRSLLSGRLVSDALLDRPSLHLDLTQLREERTDEVELDERGWQDAILAAYPLEVNRLEVRGGALAYRHGEEHRPLELSSVELLAHNLRNVRSPEDAYPSRLRATARVLERGSLALEGRADLLAPSEPVGRAAFRLEEVPLDRLDPVARDARLMIRGGALSARGEVRTSAAHRSLDVEELLLAGVRIDYLFDPEQTRRAVEAAEEIERDDDFSYRLGRLRLTDGEIGFVDRRREPGYRLFLGDADLRVTDLASRSRQPSEVRLEGRFMGSGETVGYGVFRPDDDGADFDVGLAIRGTELASMNDLLRSYAKLDVRDGTFSFYSEVEVAGGRLDGYVKPLVEDVDVYDREQDRHEGFFHRIWERIVEGLAELLANRPRDEVATIAELQGSVDDPRASNIQILLNLLRNAFIDAILPGFEDEPEDGR